MLHFRYPCLTVYLITNAGQKPMICQNNIKTSFSSMFIVIIQPDACFQYQNNLHSQSFY